ncbi:MAG TPA: lantibiotic dehydratase, partial [Flavobacterium sp.]|uniref:lantibiotic dehydratase n=1 Tax=Flavobacterium sp. TaxID=239 RepID=UPI002ED4E5B6
MIFFDTIVKRVTNFSIQSFENNKKNIASFFANNELFQLSILTSSTVLYEDIKKNKSDKIKASLSKYFIRAHFNPTPFGVFSSVGTLKWGEFTAINKDKTVKLNVKYDNLFLANEINNTITSKWHTLSYCINPTIHFLNDYKIGFYKSKNLLNDKIESSYTEIDYDDDLQWIIDRFKNCIKVDIVLEELIL